MYLHLKWYMAIKIILFILDYEVIDILEKKLLSNNISVCLFNLSTADLQELVWNAIAIAF